MGREIKRVAADFAWPLGQVWSGFVNPHQPRKCPSCKNGYSAFATLYQDEWYGNAPFSPQSNGSEPFGWDHPLILQFAEDNILYDFDTRIRRVKLATDDPAIRREAQRLAGMWDQQWMHHLSQADVDALLDGGRLYDFTHVFVPGAGWQPKEPPCRPTAKEVNEWSIRRGLGHDSINCWVCVKARCVRNGVPDTCPACGGNALDPTDAETIAAGEAWEQTEPPSGVAYQIWETVSEGSPVTPAFADPEELARWCAAHQFEARPDSRAYSKRPWNRLAGGEESLSLEEWLKFIVGPGWAMSAVSGPDGLRSGVAALVKSS